MIKKRILLLLNLLLIPAAYALTPESLLQTYLDFYGWFDFMAYLLIFIGASKLAIEKAFKKTGEESKSISLLYTGLGLLFSLSLVTWEIKSGFYLFQLGPLVLILFGLLIIAWIWRLFKSKKEGEKKSARVSMRYIAIFFLLLIVSIYAIFPDVLYYYYWSNWIKEALAILMIICGLIIIFSYASSEEEGEKGEKGKAGETWWERRKAKKEKESRKREEIESAIRAKEEEDARRKAERDAIREEQLAEEKRLREQRLEDEKRARAWRIEDEEIKKKRKLKDIEDKKKQEKEDKERAKKEAIEAIGKIKCSIKISSQLQGKIVDRKDISVNDKIHVEAIITETSGRINYTWTIQKRKLEAANFDIIAKQFGVGKHSIELKVEDLVTGHTSKDSTTITIKEKTKIEKEIEKESLPPFDVSIKGSIWKKDSSGGGLTRKGPLEDESIIGGDETIKAEPSIDLNLNEYNIKWECKQNALFNIFSKEKKHVSNSKEFNIGPFDTSDKRRITLKVEEKSTGRKTEDSIKINVNLNEKKLNKTLVNGNIEAIEGYIDPQLETIEDIKKRLEVNLGGAVGRMPILLYEDLKPELEIYKESIENKKESLDKIRKSLNNLKVNKELTFSLLSRTVKEEKKLFERLETELKKDEKTGWIIGINLLMDIKSKIEEQRKKLKNFENVISKI